MTPKIRMVLDKPYMFAKTGKDELSAFHMEYEKEGNIRLIESKFQQKENTLKFYRAICDLSSIGSKFSSPMVMKTDKNEYHVFFINFKEKDAPDALGGEDALFNCMKVKRRLDIWYLKYDDNENILIRPKILWKGYTGSLNSLIETSSGRIILPFSYQTDRSWYNKGGEGSYKYTYIGNHTCTAIYSDDLGKTWKLASDVNTPASTISTYGGIEPIIIELKNQILKMLIRTQTGVFYESYSYDNGTSWSFAKPSDIISSDSPGGIARLPNKNQILFWNKCLRYPYSFGGRHVLHGAVSKDDGKTWQGHREIIHDPKLNELPPDGGDFGTAYSFPVVMSDDCVFIRTGQGKGRQLLVEVDPKWLLQKSAKSNFTKDNNKWTIFGTKGVELKNDFIDFECNSNKWACLGAWNFPALSAGTVEFEFYVKKGYDGAKVMLTDHFSTPFDLQDEQNCNVLIDLSDKSEFNINRWNKVKIDWNPDNLICSYSINDNKKNVMYKRAGGEICYIRFKCLYNGKKNSGFKVRNVSVKKLK